MASVNKVSVTKNDLKENNNLQRFYTLISVHFMGKPLKCKFQVQGIKL